MAPEQSIKSEKRHEEGYEPMATLLSGKPLRSALGFASAEAFRTAVHSGRLPVRVFKIQGRQGWFARSADVSAWLGRLDELADGGSSISPALPND